MLPKIHRLTFQEFQLNFHKSQYFKKQLLSFQVKESSHDNIRLGVLVPKYLNKRSVYRHRTKRIIIEAVRLELPKLISRFDVLIKANRILNKKDHNEIVKDLADALSQLK